MSSAQLERERAHTPAGSRRTSVVVWAILAGGVLCFGWAAMNASRRNSVGVSAEAPASAADPARP